MDILLASGNRHKRDEIQAILAFARILTPPDLGIAFDHDETGDTFLDNALGKALHLHELSRMPVLADDSGLVVPSLGGAPGVLSARYGERPGGVPLSDRDRYELLLRQLDGIEERDAMFVCCMVYVASARRFAVVQETVEGEIAPAPVGKGGFGYDPVFYVPEEGCTVAEMSAQHKNAISHRGKALEKLKPVILAYCRPNR